MSLQLPIGYENFAELVQSQLSFVDKTLLIQELLDDVRTKVTVITRPRRFGKTLNLSMLQHFLAEVCYGTKTAGLFDHLKIAQINEGHYVQKHQGQYPVIFLTLKSIQDASFELAYKNFEGLLAGLYREHRFLLDSPALDAEQKTVFQAILEKRASREEVERSLLNLCQYLYQHTNVKPWLLIDEYDTPLQAAYIAKTSDVTEAAYYKDMVALLRALFGAAFKTNPYLNRAVVTGILRIAKESLFSDVNNLKVFSVLNDHYSQYFGFTQEEVNHLLAQNEWTDKQDEVRDWYNGYQFGHTTVYNPWSIVNYFYENGVAKPYWINTSGNALVKELLFNSTDTIKDQFQFLLEGKTIATMIDENMVFGELRQNTSAVWTLLLMSGYLKVASSELIKGRSICNLAVPNFEIGSLYEDIIQRWLCGPEDFQWYNQFLEYLLTANFEAFQRELESLMERVVSSHDTASKPENFYHGFLVGLTANLLYNKNYRITSNRESGYGRYDYLILSLDSTRPSLVIELKRVKAAPNDDDAAVQTKLEAAAGEALQQIQTLAYFSEAKAQSRAPVLQLALAFCGKRFVLKTGSY